MVFCVTNKKPLNVPPVVLLKRVTQFKYLGHIFDENPGIEPGTFSTHTYRLNRWAIEVGKIRPNKT